MAPAGSDVGHSDPPEITATSPDHLDPEAEQMAREERWS
jgi:hypothetical protein